MTVGSAQDAIALLIDLAQRGEIDPWDVQVIEVIDRYLSEVALRGDFQPSAQIADLSESGQAFVYASMLVLLKADTLERLESPPAELDSAEAEAEAWAERRLPLQLERHLRRRACAQPPQSRRVTLPELIDQLQQMAADLEEKPHRPRPRRQHPQSQAQAARAIAQLAHQENLTETAAQLEEFLHSHGKQLPQGQDWLELDQLLELWAGIRRLSAESLHHPPSEATATQLRQSERVGVFWALLLLSAQSKVELVQEEFYQDLKIRTICEGDTWAELKGGG